MQHLRNILREFVKGIGIEDGVILSAMRRQWVSIVGHPVAKHTIPDTIRGKVLTILVDTPQWLHHLGFYREEISEKLKPYNVGEIRFRLGRIPQRTDECRDNGTVDLNDGDLRYVENTIRNIKDTELREKFRALITRGLTKGNRKR